MTLIGYGKVLITRITILVEIYGASIQLLCYLYGIVPVFIILIYSINTVYTVFSIHSISIVNNSIYTVQQ